MICEAESVPDRGPYAYRPQAIRNRAGNVITRFPEVRLMPGPKYLARIIRKFYVRTGRYPPASMLGS